MHNYTQYNIVPVEFYNNIILCARKVVKDKRYFIPEITESFCVLQYSKIRIPERI